MDQYLKLDFKINLLYYEYFGSTLNASSVAFYKYVHTCVMYMFVYMWVYVHAQYVCIYAYTYTLTSIFI